MTTDEVLAAWRDWQTAQALSDRTITERATAIRHLIAHAKTGPTEITPDHIIRFLARPGLTESTKASYHSHIRAYCKWLVKTDRRLDDPTIKTPTPRRPKQLPRPVSDDQCDRILAVAGQDPLVDMMVKLYALGGVREFEIAKFHDDDVDLERGVMTITGKGGKTAPVALQDELWDAMLEFRAGKPRGYWFPSPEWSGRAHITRSWVYVCIKSVMVGAGVDGTPHQLRHWFGTTLIENDVPLRVAQEMMRHSSPATTAIYTKVDMRLQRRAIAKIRTPGNRSLYGDLHAVA